MIEQTEARFLEILKCGDGGEMARWLGFEARDVPIEGNALRAWGLSGGALPEGMRMRLVVAQSGLRILHLEGEAEYGAVRALMMKVDRSVGARDAILWWWTTKEEWTAAMVSGEGGGRRRRVKRLVLDVEEPDELGRLTFRDFGADRVMESGPDRLEAKWRVHLEAVLAQDGVTRAFFVGFRGALQSLMAGLEHGPDDEEERHALAITTLLRVLFLYFLQARGALNGDRRFLMRAFQRASAEGKGEGESRDEEQERQTGRGSKNFYRGVLRPLFFGALNCPPSQRPESVRAFGALPFLNGGLFEPTRLERAWPQMNWGDAVWGPILAELFERHRFAVEWSREGDLMRAVDPEMLGKVFEGLMYGERRGVSGSFYTPREVVATMVEETVRVWLEEKIGLEGGRIRALVEGDGLGLGGKEIVEVREALAELTILDPAVGTGAFLLEALRVLWRIEVALDRSSGVVRTAGERYEQMRQLVHRHLFGVDVEATAVRLCELRVWLAMLASLPELPASNMPPLPNLSHKLCVGNSLIEPLDWVRYRRLASQGRRAGLGRALGSGAGFSRASVERLATLQESYTRAHGEEKRELKRRMEALQGEVQQEVLAGRRARLEEEISAFERLKKSKDLFGESVKLGASKGRALKKLRAELESVEEAISALAQGQREEAGFSFEGHFAPVMARGGFEVVITNPPWVRATRLGKGVKGLYRARYESADHQLWRGAKEIGVEATFGAQADLSALFLERSLELLRPGGRLTALIPAKLFRSLLGTGVRGVLGAQEVEFVEDRSEAREALFDATTYPAVLRVRKRRGSTGKGVRRDERKPTMVNVWRQGRCERFSSKFEELLFSGGDWREPWLFVPPEVQQVFRKIQANSVSLGSCYEVRRGVMTGCNRAFLFRPEEVKAFSEEVQERYFRWAIRGKDLEGGQVLRRRKILWAYNERGEVEAALPQELRAYLGRHEKALTGRSDYRAGQPVWALYRCHADLGAPKVIWRDLGQELEPVVSHGEEIALNTVYYLSTANVVEAQRVAALLESEPVRAMAYALGERARGEWRRHFSWVMRMLPVPVEWGQEEYGKAGVAAAAFGLSPAEVEVLRAWRTGEVMPCVEVA